MTPDEQAARVRAAEAHQRFYRGVFAPKNTPQQDIQAYAHERTKDLRVHDCAMCLVCWRFVQQKDAQGWVGIDIDSPTCPLCQSMWGTTALLTPQVYCASRSAAIDQLRRWIYTVNRRFHSVLLSSMPVLRDEVWDAEGRSIFSMKGVPADLDLTWVAHLDDSHPHARFAHPVVWLLIEPDTGKVIVAQNGNGMFPYEWHFLRVIDLKRSQPGQPVWRLNTRRWPCAAVLRGLKPVPFNSPDLPR